MEHSQENDISLPSTFLGHQPSDAEVEKLVSNAEKYTLANHLLMGIWGIISVSNL